VKVSEQEIINIDQVRFYKNSLIGEGASGEVHLARHKETSEPYAIKIFKSNIDIKNLKREFKILSSLELEGIVQIYCLNVSNKYLIMEYIEGLSLDRYIQELNDFELFSIAKKIAKIMHEVHKKNIIHRDLKPSNIVLRKEGDPVIVDFGIAKNIDITHQASNIMGTFDYMSPEQLNGKRLFAQSDIYSFGILILELITGKRKKEYISSIKNKSLQYIIKTATSEKISDRFLNMAEVYRSIERAEEALFSTIDAAKLKNQDSSKKFEAVDLPHKKGDEVVYYNAPKKGKRRLEVKIRDITKMVASEDIAFEDFLEQKKNKLRNSIINNSSKEEDVQKTLTPEEFYKISEQATVDIHPQATIDAGELNIDENIDIFQPLQPDKTIDIGEKERGKTIDVLELPGTSKKTYDQIRDVFNVQDPIGTAKDDNINIKDIEKRIEEDKQKELAKRLSRTARFREKAIAEQSRRGKLLYFFVLFVVLLGMTAIILKVLHG
jgi:Kae1-associated kinase Bud32